MKEESNSNFNIQFWIFALGFCLLWVLLPTFFHPAYRIDVLELQIIGKEWQLSTAKHPMLPAWILETVNLITNHTFAAPFIAAQLCVLLTLWSIWSFAKTVLSPKLALWGTLAMFPYCFFTIESTQYNQNIVLIALWTLTVSRLFLAVTRDRLRDWIIVGVALGFAFHAKYSAAFLVLAILFYMAICSFPRQRWKGIGPYLTTVIALLIFLPHLIWLYQHDFVCFRYVEASVEAKGKDTLVSFVISPLLFLAGQLSFVILSTLILIPLLGWRWKIRKAESNLQAEARKYLGLMVGLPLGLHVLVSLIARVQLTPDYGAVFWPFFGIFLLLAFKWNATPQTVKHSFRLFVLAEFAMVVALIFHAVVQPYVLGDVRQFHFPMQALGVAADKIWGEHSTQPCPYTTGDWRIAANAAITMKDRPSVLFYYNGSYSGIENMSASPTGFWASDADVNEKGGLVFWSLPNDAAKATSDVSPDVPDYVLQRFPNAMVQQESIVLPYQTKAHVPPLQIGVAVVPPKLQ